MISRRRFLKVGGLTISTAGLVDEVFSRTAFAQEPKLQSMVTGVKPLGSEDYEERLEQARKIMAKTGIDALFVSGGSDLGYFTNVNWFISERTFGGIINRKGKTIWVWPAFEAESAREMIPRDQELRTWEEHENPFQLIGGVMKDLVSRLAGSASPRPPGASLSSACVGTSRALNLSMVRLSLKDVGE